MLTPRQSADTEVVHTSWVTGHLDAAKRWPKVEHQGSWRTRGKHSHNNSRRCKLQQQTARPAHDTMLASPPNPKPSWDSSGTGTRCSIYHRAAHHLQAPGSAAQRWHRHPKTPQHPQIKDALAPARCMDRTPCDIAQQEPVPHPPHRFCEFLHDDSGTNGVPDMGRPYTNFIARAPGRGRGVVTNAPQQSTQAGTPCGRDAGGSPTPFSRVPAALSLHNNTGTTSSTRAMLHAACRP
jgi:hypothetical protein